MDKKRLYESVLEQFLSGDSVSARGEELWRGKSAAASKKLGEYKDYKAAGGSGLSDLATSQLGSKDFYTPSTLREFDAEKTFRSYLDQQGFVRKFRNEGVWDVEGNAPSAWSDSFLTDQLKALQGRIADSKVKDEEHNARQKQRAAQAAELRKLSDDYYHGLSYEELLDAFAGDEEQISSVVNDWLSLNGITSPSENAPSTWDELRSIEDEEEYQDWLNKLHSGWVNAEWNTLGLPEEYTSETAGLQNQYDNALKEQESRNSWNIYKNLAEQTSGTLDLEKYYRENIDGYGQQDVQIEGYDSEVFSADRMLNLVYFINHAHGSGYQFNTLSALQGTGLFSNKELDTVWGYYEKGYNFLLPEEIVVYNDLYATDPKIAQGFLDSLQEDLLKRRYMVKNAETDVLATSKELAVPAFMASVWGNAIDAVSALPKAVQTLQGNDSYFSPLNDPANLARGIRSAQGEGLGEYEWANKLGTVGGNNVLQQFYYGGASAVDNAFRLGAGGGNPAVALALAGMGSTSSALQDLSLRDDMSPAAKVTQAALTGALEVATEKIGLDYLFKMDVTSAGKYLLNSMGAELGEEVINALGQEGLDYVVAQVFGHEADIKSAGERGTDLINTVIQTAISAALMGSGGAASIAISNQNAGNTLKNQGDLDAVVSIAENLGENTESVRIAKTIREMQKGGKGVSNYNIGRLVRAVVNDIGEENAQVVNRVAEEAIENRLVELGQSPEAARKNAPAIRKVSQGGKLNLKERTAVAWDDRATQVLKEMTAAPSAEEAEGPEQVNWRQEMETATQEAKATADGRQKQLADALTTKSSTTGRVAKAAQKADSLASGKNKSLAPTEVTFKQEGESVKGTFTRFEKGKDGSLRLVVTAGNTEKTVSIDEVTSAGDKGMATIYHYVQDPRHEMSAQEASTMVNTYAQVGGDAGTFVLDFENAYLSGYSGMESPGTQKDNKVYAIAYDQGKQEAAADEKTRVEKARHARRVETPSVGWLGEVANDADVKGPGKPGSLKEAMNGFTDSQKAMAEFATALSETAKVNISLFASKADSKGNITVQNGSYDPNTHTIYLDINSGAQTAEERSALLKTGSLGDAIGRVAGHEVTHVLENTSVEYYSLYKQAVKAAFKAKGVDYSSLIHEKLKVALENGEKLTYYGAEAEVIADASEYMLQDSKFVKNLETGLKGKIKGIVQTLLDKVNEAFKRLGLSGHFESRILRTMQEGVAHYEKNLQSLWDLAFDEMLGAEDDILREKGVEPTKWQGPNGEQMEVGGKEKVQYAIRDGLITTASTEQERYNVLKDDSYENIQKSAREQTVPVNELPTTRQFSMRTSVEKREDGLMAVHNLSADKLTDTLELGGFPMPSIAIVKAKHGHTMYGGYSVIFRKDTIDPEKNAENRVYGNDAWTPTFPQVETEIDSEKLLDVRKKMSDSVKKLDGYMAQRVQQYFNQLAGQEETTLRIPDLRDNAWNNHGMLAAYLTEQGQTVNIMTNEVVVDRGYNVENAEMYDAILDVMGDDANVSMRGFYTIEKYGQALADANDKLAVMYRRYQAGDRRSGIAMLNRVTQAKAYNAAGRDTTVQTKTENDYDATRLGMQAQIDRTAYNTWVEDVLAQFMGKKGIYNGKERFTNSGNRRSFKYLHDAYTAENVIRAMQKEPESDISPTNAKGLQAAAARRYDSIEAIRADSSRLGKVSEEEYNAALAEIDNELHDFLNSIEARDYDKQEQAGNLLVKAAKSTMDNSGIVRLFKSNGFMKITPAKARHAQEIIRQAQNMPTGYFEAKPARVVNFDEVAMLIAPQDMPAELADKLDELGIKYTTYDGTDEDRLEKTNAVENVQFSRRDDGSAYHSEAMTVADGMQDTDGKRMFSLRSFNEDYDTYRAMLMNHNVPLNEINDLFDTIDEVMKAIEKDREILDFGWNVGREDRSFNPVKPNSDPLYEVSLDFSTLCRKRLLQQTVQERLEAMYDTVLTKAERVAIRNELMKLREEGKQIEVACALCYVESTRLKSPAQIQRFFDDRRAVMVDYFAKKNKTYMKEVNTKADELIVKFGHEPGTKKKELNSFQKKAVENLKQSMYKKYTPSEEEEAIIATALELPGESFKTDRGLWNLKKEHEEIFDAYTSFVRNATKSKGIEGDEAWWVGDSKSISDKLIEKMNKENGLRTQSWSDFQVIHLLDYISAIIELSTRGAKMQSYTKVPDFVKLMGDTGVMINLSLIPKGFDGTLNYDPIEGMPIEEALALREMFPNTAGTICIGITDKHIRILLADPNTDYVIPYHSSSLDKKTRQQMGMKVWEDFQSYQNEKNKNYPNTDSKSDKYHKKPLFSEWFDYKTVSGRANELATEAIAKLNNPTESQKVEAKRRAAEQAMKEASEHYKELCHQRGLQEKFEQFSGEPNYWKLLIDRKMINQQTGEIIKQEAVQPHFNKDRILDILSAEVKRFKKQNADKDAAVEHIVEAWENGEIRKAAKSKKVRDQVSAFNDTVTVASIVASAAELDAQEQTQKSIRDLPEDTVTYRDYLTEADSSIAATIEERNALSIYQKLLKNHAEASEKVIEAEAALAASDEAHKPEARKALAAARVKQKDLYNRLLNVERQAHIQTLVKRSNQIIGDLYGKDQAEFDKMLADKERRIAALKADITGLKDAARTQREADIREQEREVAALKSKATKALLANSERYQRQIDEIRMRRDINIEIGKRTRHIKRIVKRLNDRIIHEEDYKNVKEPLKPVVHKLVQTFIDGFGNMVFDQKTADRLRSVYDEIANEDGAPEFYSDDVANWLSELSDMKEWDALIRSEGSSSLGAAEEKLTAYSRVAEIADHIYKMVTDADEIFVNGKRESFAAISAEVGNALHAVKDKPLLAGKARKATETLDDLLVRGNLTPQYFFESLKNSGLTSLFNGLLDGQTRYAQAIREGRDAVKEAKRTYKYDSWRNLKIPVEFKTEQGHVIALTTEQMMWVYATAKREATNKLMDTHHLDHGGFRYEANDLPRLKGKMEAIPGSDRLHKLSAADVKKITDTLTAEQKACADELVSYLSNECAELGNEASLELFGIKKYNEEYYFPFKTASDQRYQRSDTGSTSTTNDARVKHASFTHNLRKGANTPLVMGNFFDVISDHINLMATYSSFVVPIESMNRVLNAKMNEDADDSGSEVTIRSMIGRKHGDAAQKYIADLIKDLNGGPQTDNRGGMSALFRAFKRGAVMGSLSVALQQPTSIVRAFSYVNPKYFAHITMEGNKKTWDRMMKYSGTAVIKDMGKFDVGTGKMANDWIANSDVQDYKLLKRMKFLMDNKGFIAAKNNFVETLTALPGFMDRVTWTHIWKAVEAEQAELNPGMDRNSEEFLRTVGARFDDVINHTQVYDSVLAKSQNMRSKNPLTQMSTAFMSEPTLNANMYFSALTGQHTPAERTGMIASVIASNILAAAFAAMISAWNKDDDKRKFGEKYLGEFASRAVDNINPLTMIPYVADLWNMFSGYDIERTDLSVVKDLLDYGTIFFGKLKDGDDITWRDVENFGGTIANLTGIPAKNISRDIRRIRNLIFTDKSASSPAAIKYTLLENAIPLGLWNDSNKAYCQRLVSAVLDGDTQEAYDLWDYLTNSKKASTDSLNSNIRTDLKERVKSGEITPAQATSILRKYASYKNDKDNIGKPLEWLKETE